MLKFLGSLLLAVVITALIAAAVAYDAQRLLNRPLRLDEVTRVTVERGARLQEVVDQLRGVGAFTNPRQWRYLIAWARLQKADAQIKAGDFDIAPGTNSLELLALLVEGRAVMSELRIPEGWRFAQAMELVRAHPDLVHTLPDGLTDAEVMAVIGSPGVPAEGQLFPDTYRFTKGMKDVDFLRHAQGLLKKTLDDEWAKRSANLPYKNTDEVLVMASIIEKETGAAFERPKIAGVFLRRLSINMRLQTDPTVIYGLGAAYDGNLRRVDLTTDTPYNTYTRAGLPPTPICLVGRAAIHAALHPEDDGSLYFVAKPDGSGTHTFSKNLDDHNAAVRRLVMGR